MRRDEEKKSDDKESIGDLIIFDVYEKSDLSSALRSHRFLDSITLSMNADQITSQFDPLGVSGLMASLKSSGVLKINIFPNRKGNWVNEEMIRTSFLLAGLKSESEIFEKDGSKTLTARKKAASKESSTARIKLNIGNKTLNSKVMLSGIVDDSDDDFLIDEDNLISVAPLPPVKDVSRKSAQDDCGGRKACDDCTCGRAEREKVEGAQSEAVTSSCGNCSKGDAFRCAGCPFLGKPAFKAGEENVYLDLTDDL